jgi:hypothetical protein
MEKRNRPSLSGRFWDKRNRLLLWRPEGGEGNRPARSAQEGLRQAARLRLLRPMHPRPTPPPDGRRAPVQISRFMFYRPISHAPPRSPILGSSPPPPALNVLSLPCVRLAPIVSPLFLGVIPLL